MAKVQGVQRMLSLFKRKGKEAREAWAQQAVVGYEASYSIFVHENLEARHTNGQAKFLEQPARMLAKELGSMIKAALWRGADPADALLLAGLKLQRESQRLVPVETGNLRASAFTRLEPVGEMGGDSGAAEGGGEE